MKTTKLTSRFERALTLAHRLHRTQLRKGTGIPYISHLMAVSALVLEDGGSESEAIAAILHDAVEDQGGLPTLRLIKRQFGPRVAGLVAEVTDAFEKVGTRCYDVPHDMSPNAIRLVRDSIIAEVTTDAQCVVDEITDGSLGAKALANRIQIASELREKAALYERLLGEALPVITEKIDEIDNARAAAVIIQSTKEDEDAPKPAKKKARRS
jgi:hypothetical protein